MGLAQTRLDGPTVGAFARQLEHIEAKVIETKYPELKAAEGKLFQIDEVNEPWALSTTFQMVDYIGDFELADDQTTNLPFVDIIGEEFSQRVFSYRSGYRYTEKEIASFAKLGSSIETLKVNAARQAYMQTLNRLLLTGDPRTRTPGFLNHPGWLRSIAPYKLDGSVTDHKQLLACLTAGANGIIDATQDIAAPDTLLLPSKQYHYLNSQATIGSLSEKTVLRWFLDNNDFIKNIDFLRELNGAGPNGEDVAIFYNRRPENFKALITDPYRFRPLQIEAFSVYRPVAFDYAGLKTYVPRSVHLMLGV